MSTKSTASCQRDKNVAQQSEHAVIRFERSDHVIVRPERLENRARRRQTRKRMLSQPRRLRAARAPVRAPRDSGCRTGCSRIRRKAPSAAR